MFLFQSKYAEKMKAQEIEKRNETDNRTKKKEGNKKEKNERKIIAKRKLENKTESNAHAIYNERSADNAYLSEGFLSFIHFVVILAGLNAHACTHTQTLPIISDICCYAFSPSMWLNKRAHK